jgi:hypothetical protein
VPKLCDMAAVVDHGHCCVRLDWATVGRVGALFRWQGRVRWRPPEAMRCGDVDGEPVAAAAEVLDEGMAAGDHSGRPEPFQPAHRNRALNRP